MAVIHTEQGITHEDDRFGIPMFGVSAHVMDSNRYSADDTPVATPEDIVEASAPLVEVSPPELPDSSSPLGHVAVNSPESGTNP